MTGGSCYLKQDALGTSQGHQPSSRAPLQRPEITWLRGEAGAVEVARWRTGLPEPPSWLGEAYVARAVDCETGGCTDRFLRTPAQSRRRGWAKRSLRSIVTTRKPQEASRRGYFAGATLTSCSERLPRAVFMAGQYICCEVRRPRGLNKSEPQTRCWGYTHGVL